MSRAQKFLVAVKKSGFHLSVTQFTQSLGAELLTNGNFAAWTGDNPDGWTVSGESGSDPQVCEVATGQDHASCGTPGGGLCNMFTSATVFQPVILQTVFTAGQWIELLATLDTVVAGGVQFLDQSAGFAISQTTVGAKSMLVRATNTQLRIRSSAASSNVTIDNVSAKVITPNVAVNAVANGSFTFTFTLPVSPIAGQRCDLRYRRQDDLNYWTVYLLRNAANSNWDLRIDSVSAGAVTNRRNVANVGNVDAVGVDVSGTVHQGFTVTGGTKTLRGATVDVSHLDAQLGVQTIYNSPFVPTLLQVTA